MLDALALAQGCPLPSTDPDAALAAAPPDLLFAVAERVAIERVAKEVGGVKRERAVRWDRFTATFMGLGPRGAAMVRTVLPGAPSAIGRWLEEEGQALRAAHPSLEVVDGALVVDLPGASAAPLAGHDPAVVRAYATGLSDLQVREEQGLGAPPLGAEELRTRDGEVHVICLTRAADCAGGLASLASTLSASEAGPLQDLLVGQSQHPAESVADAVALLTRALARELVALRHSLHRRWLSESHGVRQARLASLVARLERAVPPPDGRAVVGVDLQGEPTLVESAAGDITWGPMGQASVVFDREGFQVSIARQLLRARAAAPPNERLNDAAGGDVAFVEPLCRWISAGLQLRTIDRLLSYRLS